MSVMFWIWLAVIVITAVVELITTELISIWFTFGAIVPFILAAINVVGYEWQILIFVIVSAVLILTLRKITKKFLLRNSNSKTNTDLIIGKHFRMLGRTDFETVGSIKVNDVEWSAVDINQQSIEKGEVVEVVKISGNKLFVKKINVEEK